MQNCCIFHVIKTTKFALATYLVNQYNRASLDIVVSALACLSFVLITLSAFPNSKISPPKRGDSDFKLRSKKLNSAYDMIEDNLRSKVDQHWEALQKHFHDIDSLKTGFVTKEQFQVSKCLI